MQKLILTFHIDRNFKDLHICIKQVKLDMTSLDKPARLTISWYLDLLLMVFVKLNQNYYVFLLQTFIKDKHDEILSHFMRVFCLLPSFVCCMSYVHCRLSICSNFGRVWQILSEANPNINWWWDEQACLLLELNK